MNQESILITGGAGFVGSNLAHRLAQKGKQVIVLDNLSRSGTEKNLQWLQMEANNYVKFIHADVRDFDSVQAAVGDVGVVYHLAAQVAVTSSVADPREDLETNVLGTFNVLESCRRRKEQPIVVFTSTNKVYGALPELDVVLDGQRYCFAGTQQCVSEAQPLDFHSPYGCSKGAADQYVHDFCRIYGIPTIVFRMSCIYGPRQFGNEDQGWVAHFVISALQDQGLTIYGDGKQVRDVLYVQDLVDAFEMAPQHLERTAGNVYNIGGGTGNSVSIVALIELLEKRLGRHIPKQFCEWRPGDQKIYISDVRKAERDFGWKPATSVSEGVERLMSWVSENGHLFEQISESVQAPVSAA